MQYIVLSCMFSELKVVKIVKKNGVKQGGVLSPVMFCVCIDDLLVQLARIGAGYFIGRKFVGALAMRTRMT